LSERFSKCETACKFLEKYKIPLQSNTNWIDELDSKLKDLEEYEAKGNLGSGEVTIFTFHRKLKLTKYFLQGPER